MWLPPKVDRELRDESQRWALELARETFQTEQVCEDFTRELRKIDPYLRLIRAAPDATTMGLLPGYYHIMRENPGAPASLIPITDEKGGFREPDSSIFEELRRNDLWSERSVREKEHMREAASKAAEARRAREHSERVEEMMDRISAGRDVKVSMSTDSAWSQNVAGRRGAKKA